MTDEGADEVKVFRRTDAEDLETNAQSSHQLAEDKKDVVLETELESRPNGDPLIGVFWESVCKARSYAYRCQCEFLSVSVLPAFSPSFY
ncbi:hypothetical protein OESDEN_11085 [Oesophagostomum dentatum]|uniref:Uncharacterized protein n=2 Tax=Strongylidae TaxID=27830 RepID=A0A0B1SUY4_OESDE|nr:hypothetical protein OESDEN_11085 [Oesophagostomum dentatum]